MLIRFCAIILFFNISKLLGQFSPHFYPGRSVIVNLFEWKWSDVAKECVTFLGPKGFGGVQVSPAVENVIAKGRPWWERYQPISYELDTRSGSEMEFKEMVQRCNEVGVRIYVDVVLNHMAGGGGNVIGTGGNIANPRLLDYPNYNEEDFHYECHIDNRSDHEALKTCRLTSLPDLNHASEFVQIQILELLNKLIDFGVAGFHIDSAKFMWPRDLKTIFKQMKNLNILHGFLPFSRPLIMMDVYDLGDEDKTSKFEYQSLGLVSDYTFASQISKIFSRQTSLSYLKSWPDKRDFLPTDKALIFVETHLTERQMHPMGHSTGNVTLTFRDRKKYIMALCFMLATNYGLPRIFSSYEFLSREQGPPMDSIGRIISPDIDLNGRCLGGYLCQHRWPEVVRMIEFRTTAYGEPLHNWADNGADQIAFCVGNKGFVAFNGYNLAKFDSVLQVCLPEGVYCNVIAGQVSESGCTGGGDVVVNGTGFARITIPANHKVGVLAIHVGQRFK